MAADRVYLGWREAVLPAAARWLVEQGRRINTPGGGADLSNLAIVLPTQGARRRLIELLTEAHPGLVLPELMTVGSLADVLCPSARVAPPTTARFARLDTLRRADPTVLAAVMPSPPAAHEWPRWYSLAALLEQLADDLAAGGLRVSDVAERVANLQLPSDEPERWHALATLDDAYHQQLAMLGYLDRQRHRLDWAHNPANDHAEHEATRVDDVAADAAADADADAGGQAEAEVDSGGCSGGHSGAGSGGVWPRGRRLVLLAIIDRNPLVIRLLDRARPEATALIAAPESEAAGFDAWGFLDPAYWARRTLDLDPHALWTVDRADDQPAAAVEQVERWAASAAAEIVDDPEVDAGGNAVADADGVTVGLCDEAIGPAVRRAFTLAGARARLASAGRLDASRPARLLRAVAQFAGTERFDAMAELMRHPDVEALLPDAAAAGARAGWLGTLDAYFQAHLTPRITGHWLGDTEQQQAMAAAYQVAKSLLQPTIQAGDPMARPGDKRPLREQLAIIEHALIAAYEPHDLHRDRPEDQTLIAALEGLGRQLESLRALALTQSWTHADVEARPDAEGIEPVCDFADAVALLLLHVGEDTLPGEWSREPAIEIAGYLELLLDDAPDLVLLGVNEAHLPTAGRSPTDTFLPDTMRSALGLADSRQRFARDAFILRVALQSRRRVRLLAARAADEGEPLPPSRVLLNTDADRASDLILRFFASRDTPAQSGGDGDDNTITDTPTGQPRPLFGSGDADAPPIALPDADSDRIAELLQRLPVTAFRTYLACPYRFYLRYLVQPPLRIVDDGDRELTPGSFGNLLHAVLRRFGQGEGGVAHSDNTDDIEAILRGLLDDEITLQLGPAPARSSGVAVQHDQLMRRLRRFAMWQADQTRDGWRIQCDTVEAEHSVTIDYTVGSPGDATTGRATVVGRIDRIDRHIGTGAQRVLDYKTGDRAKSPASVHYARGAWLDLQLPLYRRMLQAPEQGSRGGGGTGDGPVTVGYINLPRKLDAKEAGFQMLEWDADRWAQADATASVVAGRIAQGVFWPPAELGLGFDEFRELALDGVYGRDASLNRAAAEHGHTKPGVAWAHPEQRGEVADA